MSKNFSYYFIPVFIAIYFVIALIPVVASSPAVNNKMGELFPFFSFKLYSKVPEGCVNYDLLFDQGLPSESFLLYKNTGLNRFERRTYGNRIGELVSSHAQGEISSSQVNSKLLENAKTVRLVKLSGSCIDRAKDDKYTLEVIKTLK